MNLLIRGRSLLRFWIFGVALWFTSTAAVWSAGPAWNLDLQRPAREIRAQLLQFTPVGASTNDVVASIGKNLPHDANRPVKISDGGATLAGESKPRGARFIHVDLGEYYDHPEVLFLTAPLLMVRKVNAVWIFDQRNRLLDLAVEKETGTY